MQQCLVVDAWLYAMVGIVLPLFLLYRLEYHDRRLFIARRLEAGWQHSDVVTSELRPQLLPLNEFAGAWLLELFLASCLVWSGATVLIAAAAAVAESS